MYEIESGVVLPPSRLDALTTRIADEVIAGDHESARSAAKVDRNLVEYTGHLTTDKLAKNIEIANLTRRIVKRLAELGFDKFGNSMPKKATRAATADLA